MIENWCKAYKASSKPGVTMCAYYQVEWHNKRAVPTCPWGMRAGVHCHVAPVKEASNVR